MEYLTDDLAKDLTGNRVLLRKKYYNFSHVFEVTIKEVSPNGKYFKFLKYGSDQEQWEECEKYIVVDQLYSDIPKPEDL